MFLFLVIESAALPVDKPKEEVSAKIAPMKNVEPIPPPSTVSSPPGDKKPSKKNAKAKDKTVDVVQPMDVSPPIAVAMEPETVVVKPQLVAEKPAATVKPIVVQKAEASASEVAPQAEAVAEKANIKKGKGKKNKKE